MSNVVKSLTVVCQGCGDERVISQQELHERLGEVSTMENINGIFLELGHDTCSDKHYNIFLPDKRTVFNSENKILCKECGIPFSELFIKLNPQANVCISCTNDMNKPSRDARHPQLSPEENICPRCGNALQWDQNSKDKSWFIRCTTFPACMYKKNPKSS